MSRSKADWLCFAVNESKRLKSHVHALAISADSIVV